MIHIKYYKKLLVSTLPKVTLYNCCAITAGIVLLLLLLFSPFHPSAQENNDKTARLDSLLLAKTGHFGDSAQHRLDYYLNLKEICEQEGYEYGSGLCDYYISTAYYFLNDGEKVIRYANEAQRKAEELKNDTLLISAKYIYAMQLGRSWRNEEAIKIFDECIGLAQSVENLKTRYRILGGLYTTRTNLMMNLDPKPSVHELINYHLKALHYYELSNKSQYISLSLYNIADCYLELKEYDSASFYLMKTLDIYKREKLSLPFRLYLEIGKTKCYQGDFALALAYLDSARDDSQGITDDGFRLLLYESYVAVYDSLNIPDSVQKYSSLSAYYKDIVNESDRDNILSTSEYLINSKWMQYLSEKKKRIIIMLSSLLIIAIATIFIVTFYRKKEKFRKEKFRKDRELLQKANEIIDLKHKVTHTYDELLELARKNDPLFIPVFKELYPDFYTNLMKVQPGMTVTELKICFCLKLNFTTKEIAQSTFVTIKAIQNRKNRLRKRLNLQEGEDLYKFINELA